VVTASDDGTARVWDAATGKAVTPPLEHGQEVMSAAFSRDGTRVVTASSDNTARVWDAATGQAVTPSLEHGSWVVTAAFNGDGTRIVTASTDKTARVWNMAADPRSLREWERVADRVEARSVMQGTARYPKKPFDVAPARYPARSPHRSAMSDLVRISNLCSAAIAALPWHTTLARTMASEGLAIARSSERDADVELATRVLATVAALEHRMSDARTALGSDARGSDADLLQVLAAWAHERLLRADLALLLLDVALAMEPTNDALLCNRTEVLLALHRYQDARTAAHIALSRAHEANLRVVLDAFDWAAARLLGQPTATPARRLVEAYGALDRGTSIPWRFRGTKHALSYGPRPLSEVEPILALLEHLENPVDNRTLAELRALVMAEPLPASPR